MNALGSRIKRLIELDGPISIAQFLTIALHDPVAGYYATRDPVGAEGDFITAPEVSQMFGELLGAWIMQAWRDQGCPSPARLVELGPGRGTLMADALRAAKLDPQFLASIEVVLIETSARLRETQAEKLKTTSVSVRWLERFDETLTDMPLFLLTNEFFDALPIRQFVFSERGWCERMVGVEEKTGALAFGLSPAPLPLQIPAERGTPEFGAVYESCRAAEELAGEIAHIVAQKGGAALILDYGYSANTGFGDTLQAVAEHEYTSVLDNPGEADLSAHVEFAALARAAERAGTKIYGPISQGEFLVTLGIVQRAETLSRRHLADAPSIRTQVERLIAPEQMGTLFKTMAILPTGAPCPEGF
jgi:NADH dehydrogenase [ubiquinone] 1 alpha subcomplex assembly factor 7